MNPLCTVCHNLSPVPLVPRDISSNTLQLCPTCAAKFDTAKGRFEEDEVRERERAAECEREAVRAGKVRCFDCGGKGYVVKFMPMGERAQTNGSFIEQCWCGQEGPMPQEPSLRGFMLCCAALIVIGGAAEYYFAFR